MSGTLKTTKMGWGKKERHGGTWNIIMIALAADTGQGIKNIYQIHGLSQGKVICDGCKTAIVLDLLWFQLGLCVTVFALCLRFPPLLDAIHHLFPSKSICFGNAHLNEVKAHVVGSFDLLQLLVQPAVVSPKLPNLSERMQPRLDILCSPFLRLILFDALVAAVHQV